MVIGAPSGQSCNWLLGNDFQFGSSVTTVSQARRFCAIARFTARRSASLAAEPTASGDSA
jgi:hypothetical protein